MRSLGSAERDRIGMRIYVEKIVLRNFRGVIRGELELAPLTILIGPNNIGKTTALEALMLLHGFRSVIDGYDTYWLLSTIHRTLGSMSINHLVYGHGARIERACVGYIVGGA